MLRKASLAAVVAIMAMAANRGVLAQECNILAGDCCGDEADVAFGFCESTGDGSDGHCFPVNLAFPVPNIFPISQQGNGFGQHEASNNDECYCLYQKLDANGNPTTDILCSTPTGFASCWGTVQGTNCVVST